MSFLFTPNFISTYIRNVTNLNPNIYLILLSLLFKIYYISSPLFHLLVLTPHWVLQNLKLLLSVKFICRVWYYLLENTLKNCSVSFSTVWNSKTECSRLTFVLFYIFEKNPRQTVLAQKWNTNQNSKFFSTFLSLLSKLIVDECNGNFLKKN